MSEIFSTVVHPAHSGWLANPRIRRPVIFVMALFTLWIDYLTGPAILFPIWFTLPVILTAWYDGFSASLGYVLLMPLARLAMKHYWPAISLPTSYWYVNFGIRITALLLIAWLAARAGQLTRHVRVLQGLLPICIYCHRMRNDSGLWERLEAYLDRRSEATFTHGICPECMSSKNVKV